MSIELDELDLENNLFTDESELENEDKDDKGLENKDKKEETIEVDENDLFSASEEVDSKDKDKQAQEDTVISKVKENNSTSPNTYSSLAIALKEDGVLSELDDDFIKSVNSADLLAEAIEKQVDSRLEAAQKRVKEALDNDVEVGEIRKFEGTITYLNSITEDLINDESAKGETLRKQLIYQDYINRNFTPERATREMNKSIAGGTDIEDALEALEGNKEFFTSQYEDVIKGAKKAADDEKKALKKEQADLEKRVLETESPFDNIKLDKSTRKVVYDNLNKPIYKDEEGTYYTAIQKFQKENKAEFMHKLGVIFTLTDGFKNMDKLVKGSVAKETRKSMKELEHVLANSGNFGGNLELMGGREDNQSYDGLKLDI